MAPQQDELMQFIWETLLHDLRAWHLIEWDGEHWSLTEAGYEVRTALNRLAEIHEAGRGPIAQ